MKKCIHCGKEIPDEAKFCGFCGTLQPETEDKDQAVSTDSREEEKETETTPVSEETTVSAENTEVKPEEPVEQTEDTEKDEKTDSSDSEVKSEEAEPVKDAEVVETADDSDSGDQAESTEDDEHEIKDAEIVKPSAEEKETTEKESSDNTVKETTEKPAEEPKNAEPEQTEDKTAEKKEKKKPHVDLKKVSLPKINVSSGDFGVLLEILKEPEKRQGINNTTTWIILIFAWIANWIAFGSFWRGFISLLIVMIGLIVINWLTLKDHATFGETVRNSAEVVFAPSLLVLIGGLFVRNIVAGAEIYSFHSIFTTAFIGLFFLTAALILFVLIIIRRYEMKSWEMVWILTILIALLTWYLITGGAIPLLS